MLIVNGLHFKNIRGDIYGGVTAAVVALPLALAFGVSSGAGAISGLYGAIFVGFFAALFGGTPAQVSGPTGPMTVVMAAIFTQYSGLDPVNGPALAFTIVILAGGMQIGLGLLGIGRYINYVPLPVISGFMSGIGMIIILLQFGPLFGHSGAAAPLEALGNIGQVLGNVIWPALVLGILTMIVVYCTPKSVTRWIPSPLLALVLGTVVALLFTSTNTVTILGDIPQGLPKMQNIQLDVGLLLGMIKSAAALALLGAIDSLLTSLVADNITHTHHKSNRELFGQGIGNMVSGLFGGLPGAGATMRTVVNIKTGGQTPISGALHALILLAIVLGIGNAAEFIPHVVLAGILIKVGTDIIDWEFFKRIPHTSRISIFIMLLVFLITVLVDLITAFAVGMTCSALVFLKRESDQQIARMNFKRGGDDSNTLPDNEKKLLQALDNNVILFQLGGPTSFGAAKNMVSQINQIDSYEILILDLQGVTFVDTTTTRALEDIINSIKNQGRQVIICGMEPAVFERLVQQRVLKQIPQEHVLKRRYDALEKAKKNLTE